MWRGLFAPLWVAALTGVLLLSACPRDGERGRERGNDASADAIAEGGPAEGDAPSRAAADDESAALESGDSAPVAEVEPMMQGQAAGAPDSGVEGMVTLGPTCPVVDPDRPCAPRPYATRLLIREATSGDQVMEVESDSAGRFRVALPPGEYLLAPMGPTVVTEPTAKPVRFTVEKGNYAKVELRFDTGVR